MTGTAVFATAAVAMLAGTIFLSGCSSSSSSPKPTGTGSSGGSVAAGTLRVNGTLTLTDTVDLGITSDGSTGCTGTGRYADITKGAQIVIADAAGKTLTVVPLGSGNRTDLDNPCVFTFDAVIPSGKKTYRVTVAHRPATSESESSMRNLMLAVGG